MLGHNNIYIVQKELDVQVKYGDCFYDHHSLSLQNSDIFAT